MQKIHTTVMTQHTPAQVHNHGRGASSSRGPRAVKEGDYEKLNFADLHIKLLYSIRYVCTFISKALS